MKYVGPISEYFRWEELVPSYVEDSLPVETEDNLRMLAFALDEIRNVVRSPVYVTSGFRDAEHNAEVGGRPMSQHLCGRAADIVVPRYPTHFLWGIVEALMYSDVIPCGGIGIHSDFLHYDIRGERALWRYDK